MANTDCQSIPDKIRGEGADAMRILIINSEYPPVGGGAGNASAHVAQALADQGQEVTVLTCRFDHLPRDTREKGVRVIRVPSLRHSESRSGPGEQLSFMLGAVLGGLRLIRPWKPDGVIAFFGVPSGPTGWVLQKFFGIPYVVSLRGGDVPGFRPYDFALYHRLIGPVIRMVWRGAGAVVANSEGLRNMAQEFAPDLEIQVIPNGVDGEEFYPVPRSWDPPRLLFVGRLVYQKGLDVLFKALADLKDIDWMLTIVGDGAEREHLEKQVDDLDLAERVCFAGWVSHDDLLDYYQEANLFVFPSRHEGMPNALLEAMSSGLPALATRIAGNEELVLDGENGILVPPDDRVALREALRKIISSGDLRKTQGEKARERVLQSYTWEATARAYLTVLRELSCS
jgi:glycosyltransferase involved in cell wall biosynthesis